MLNRVVKKNWHLEDKWYIIRQLGKQGSGNPAAGLGSLTTKCRGNRREKIR